ncbi:MAG TPA: MBL fold metallo-hydrolase [Chloroflexi bacterium]|nr:MBL fold metallo-hydrolase [Chloroflexota bacterium]
MNEEYIVPTWEPGVKQLAPNVYAYIQAKATWYWNNAGFIVGNDYVVVVDSLATVGLTQKFRDEIRKVTDKPIRYLINTHHHGDHIWGNHVFAGATIISHSYCRHEAIETGIMDPGILNTIFTEFDFQGIAVTPADITFDRQLTLHMDGREVRLLHFGPGHTAGDIIVYLPEEGIIFASDLIFLYSTPLGMEGSFAGWLRNLDIVANLGARTYVPGHGPVCGLEGLNLCREYLVLVQGEARKRFDKGMTVDEAARDIPLGQFKQWPDRERILANVERLWREFRGEDPTTSKLNIVEVFIRMATMAEAGEL